MEKTAVEWLVEQMLVCNYINKKQYDNCKSWLLQEAKEMEKQQQGYSEEEAMEFFIEGYKQRAEKSDLIFDNASRMYAIALFKQFKNK
jgi:hypothetical protein